MIGLMIALLELFFILIFAFLRITGLWCSALIIGVAMAIHFYIIPIPDNIAVIIIYGSLIPSAFFFIRNIIRICYNIFNFFRELVR